MQHSDRVDIDLDRNRRLNRRVCCVQQGALINGEHLSPDVQSKFAMSCYSHLPIHIFEDNMVIIHYKVTSCSARSQTKTLTLGRVKVVFPSLQSALPHLQAMAGSAFTTHSEAQPLESARWHRQQHVRVIQGRRTRGPHLKPTPGRAPGEL